MTKYNTNEEQLLYFFSFFVMLEYSKLNFFSRESSLNIDSTSLYCAISHKRQQEYVKWDYSSHAFILICFASDKFYTGEYLPTTSDNSTEKSQNQFC